MHFISPHFNYFAAAAILMIGLYGIIGKRNIIKKIIGLSIFQTAIILFYVSVGAKTGGNIPILEHHGDHHGATDGAAAHHAGEAAHRVAEAAHSTVDPLLYDNPLPHVLMLTAIVVGVATLGLALALAQRIYNAYGTLEEDEILAQLERAPEHD